MKKYLLALVVLFFTVLSFQSDAQIVTQIGSGTGTNTTTTYPAPFGNYWWGARHQLLYNASELSAAGILPGSIIQQLGFKVVGPAQNQMLTAFEMKVAGVPNNVLTATWLSPTWNNVFGPANYTPTTGTNSFPLSVPIVWNGTDNILIETCFNNGAYTNNETMEMTAVSASLVNHYRADAAGVCANTGSSGLLTDRTNLVITYLPPGNCLPPLGGTASSITPTSATLSWVDTLNTSPAATYDIELLLFSAPASGVPTTSGITSTSINLTTLLPNTNYSFYVRGHCSPTDSSVWSGPFNFTTPPTCIAPTSLTATNITSGSADLDWTQAGPAPVSWDIEIGLSGFTPSGVPVIPGLTTKPFNLPGLPSNSCFDYYVRTNCGGTNGNSAWSGPFTFCTAIAALSCPPGAAPSVIFSEEFTNTNTFDGVNISPANLPGWQSNFITGNPRFTLTSTTPSSASTGPSGGAQGSTGYALMEVSCVSGGTDTLKSPLIDLSGVVGAAEVKWFNHMYGPNSGKLELFIDNGTTLTSVWSDSGQTQISSTAPWDSAVVSLNSYVGQSIRLVYVGTAANPGGCSGDRGIDQVSVTGCVSCAAPSGLTASNVTATSVDLSWTQPGSASAWQFEVLPTGNTPTGIPTNTSTTNPYTLTGLTLYQAVDIYIRADCGANGVSSWVGPVTVLPCAPLAGAYTVNPAAPASATNFQTLGAVAFALQCGISAPVVFDMAPGNTFNEQVEFGEVTGASMTNTITINGNGDSVVFNTNSTNYAVVRLNGSDYFRFNDLAIVSTSTSEAIAMHVYLGNNSANHNYFTGCTFAVPTTATSSLVCPTGFSGSLTSPNATPINRADSNVIDSCTIIGGWYGIPMWGQTTAPYSSGNQITNCSFVDFYSYGLYHAYQDNLILSNNDFSQPTRTTVTTCYAVYATGSGDNNLYERNKIHNIYGAVPTSTSTFYGFNFFIDASSVANSNRIENNLIYDINGSGTHYDIYFSTANNLKVYHNTVIEDNASATGGTTRGIYQAGTTASGQDIQNNLVYITRGGTGTNHGIWLDASSLTCDYNNVYVNGAGTNYYGYNGAANQTNLAAWQASSPTVGANSYDVDPIFANPVPDYSPSNPQLNSTANTGLGVTVDITGAPRGVLPDIGAFEFSVSATDMATTAVLSPDPAVGCYSTTDTIKVEVTNFGSALIDFSLNPMTVGADVSGTITASASATVNTGTLAPLATLSVTLSPTVNMTANGPYAIKAYATTVSDGNVTNDTLAPVIYNVNFVNGSITASPDVHCVSGTSTVTMTGQAGGLIQWQTSPTGAAPWTNVGTGTNPHTTATLTSTTFYRALFTCNANIDSTNIDTIVVNNPQITSTMGDTICGTDTVNLSATSTFPINWYATATSTTILDTGSTFSAVISSTDTFYAAATAGAGKVLITEVCQFTTSSYVNPGPPYPASLDDPIELTNIGTDPIDISGWKVEVTGSIPGNIVIPPGNVIAPNGTFVIDRGFTAATDIPGVYFYAGSALNTSSGNASGYILSDANGVVQDVTATNGFNVVGTGTPAATAADWTGTTGSSSGTGGIRRTNIDDTNDGSDWTIATGTNATNYGAPNVAFTPAGCTGSRVPVIAVSNPGPPVVASATDTTVCWGDSTTLFVTGAGPGGTYSWNNGGVTGVPFVPTATTTYTVLGTNASGCSSIDSITITRIDQFFDTINATPASLCFGDSVTLTVADSNVNPPVLYCASGATNGFDTKIDTVSFAGVTNGTSLSAQETYSDYTSIVIPVTAGMTYPLAVRNGSSTSNYYGGTLTAWIDYNQNGVFEPSEQIYQFVTTGLNTIPPTTVTIPSTALTGLTRMRLILPELGTTAACGTWTYGETEDYTVNITGGVPTNSYSWSIMPGSLSGPVHTVAPTTNTTYIATQTDANGCSATTSVTVTVNPLPTVTASITPTTSCFNTTAVPTGGGASTYAWTGGLVNNQAFVVSANNTYTVTGIDANGCTATSTASVTATPASNALAQALPLNTASTPGTSNQSQSHPDGASVSYYDASCNVIASVNDGAGGNVLGNTMSMVTVDASVNVWNGQPYCPRWYDIVPTNNGPATVTLYFTQADFDAYNAHPSVVAQTYDSLPTGPASPTGNIRITKISGGGLGVGTVTGVITPTTTWNAAASRWEMQFPVTSFSQFFVHGANGLNAALPAVLRNFTVVKNGSVSDASWNTMSEQNNSHFNVQRSLNGSDFTTLGRVNSQATNGNSITKLSYAFTDNAPQVGHNYYRLEQVDRDGKASYSQIVDLVWGADGSVVSIYPNPATDKLNVDVSIDKVTVMEVRLLDMSGRVVKSVMQQTQKGLNNISLDVRDIANGVYSVQVYENNTLIFLEKVNKRNY